MLSSSLRTTFGTAALFICGCLNWVSTAFAEDLSVEEFIEYSTRRVTGVSPEVINQFAKAVDENSDGKITGEEFSKRIDAWQAVVKAVPVKKRQSGHSLPKNWFTDFEKASAEAKKTNQPMLVMFSASWVCTVQNDDRACLAGGGSSICLEGFCAGLRGFRS